MIEQNNQPKGNFGYDVFLSYSAQDYKWVREKLLPRLKRAKLRIIDEATFPVGTPMLQQREQAIQQSRYTIFVISPTWLASSWPVFDELLTNRFGLETATWRVIPLMIAPCELPLHLQMLVKIDLTAESTQGWQRLLSTVKTALDQKNNNTVDKQMVGILDKNGQAPDPVATIADRLQTWIANHIKALRLIGISSLVSGILALIGFYADVLSIGQWWGPAVTPTTVVIMPTPLVTPQPTVVSFTYGVTVKDDSSNQPIANAKVLIEVPGKAPLDEYTDTNGYARLIVPATHAERSGRLTVNVQGYIPDRKNVDLYQDRLPDEVRLKRQ